MIRKLFFLIFFFYFLVSAQEDNKRERLKKLDPMSRFLIYIPSRIVDLKDVFNLGINFGPALGLEIGLTKYLQLGALVSNPIFGFSFINGKFNLIKNNGLYYSLILGGEENRVFNDINYYDKFTKSDWEIRFQVGLGIAHVYFGINLYELYDFLAGLIFLDPSKDDYLPPFTDVPDGSGVHGTAPVDKLSRAIYNIFFCWADFLLALDDRVENDGTVKGVITGVPVGLGRTAGRFLVGWYELATFWLGGGPIVLPEYSFSLEDFPFSYGDDPTWEFNW